ncbi:MAG TPA: hypothetical protein DDZ51_06555 [Planctomycetaceae bacterium]|nr:hypothetical protein [Planctomycetaceae bacterium]
MQQQYLRARWYNPANGQFNRLDPFAGNMRDPQSLHKYAYVHGDPVQGIDPTGLFTIQGMLSSISIRVNMIQTRISKGLDVAVRIYQQLIRINVILNLTLGMMDQSLYPSIVIASPYQFKLLKDFSRIPQATLKSVTLRRILDAGIAATESYLAFEMMRQMGFRVSVKPNGMPDFGSHSYRGPRNTVFIKLTGSRRQDEIAADLARGLPRPQGYTWHHHEIMGIMQLVERPVHRAFSLPFGPRHRGHFGGTFFYTIMKNMDTYGR